MICKNISVFIHISFRDYTIFTLFFILLNFFFGWVVHFLEWMLIKSCCLDLRNTIMSKDQMAWNVRITFLYWQQPLPSLVNLILHSFFSVVAVGQIILYYVTWSCKKVKYSPFKSLPTNLCGILILVTRWPLLRFLKCDRIFLLMSFLILHFHASYPFSRAYIAW